MICHYCQTPAGSDPAWIMGEPCCSNCRIMERADE